MDNRKVKNKFELLQYMNNNNNNNNIVQQPKNMVHQPINPIQNLFQKSINPNKIPIQNPNPNFDDFYYRISEEIKKQNYKIIDDKCFLPGKNSETMNDKLENIIVFSIEKLISGPKPSPEFKPIRELVIKTVKDFVEFYKCIGQRFTTLEIDINNRPAYECLFDAIMFNDRQASILYGHYCPRWTFTKIDKEPIPTIVNTPYNFVNGKATNQMMIELKPNDYKNSSLSNHPNFTDGYIPLVVIGFISGSLSNDIRNIKGISKDCDLIAVSFHRCVYYEDRSLNCGWKLRLIFSVSTTGNDFTLLAEFFKEYIPKINGVEQNHTDRIVKVILPR